MTDATNDHGPAGDLGDDRAAERDVDEDGGIASGDVGAAATGGVLDREWLVAAIGEDPVTAGTPSLRFAGDGRLTGSTGVNRLFGEYTIADGVLTVGTAGSTLMAGPPEAMKTEARLLAALNAMAAGGPITLSGDTMQIGDGDRRLALRAEPADHAEADAFDEGAVVSGSVFYRERIAMPPGAVLRVSLLDVSRADAASDVIASWSSAEPGNVPIDFELAYDASLIDPRHDYSVRATIEVDGVLWWTSSEAHLVLTNDRPASVDILLSRVAR